MANRNISEGRKLVYYLGGVLMAVGAILFVSVFVTGAMNFGDFADFENRSRSEFLRAIAGMVIIVIGAILMGIGREGLAGSGVVLDPEKAREDMEPWSRMTGGMIKDGADEAGVDLGDPLGLKDMPFDDKLRRLHKLHEEGILTDEEYEKEKREILDQE